MIQGYIFDDYKWTIYAKNLSKFPELLNKKISANFWQKLSLKTQRSLEEAINFYLGQTKTGIVTDIVKLVFRKSAILYGKCKEWQI